MSILIPVQNPHIQNLPRFKDQENAPEWSYDLSHGLWNDPPQDLIDLCDNGQKWMGFKGGDPFGSIMTKMKGQGCAKLNYGNCYTDSNVKVFLDGQEISVADASEKSILVDFQFSEGQELKFQEGNGVILFNSYEEYSCDGKF